MSFGQPFGECDGEDANKMRHAVSMGLRGVRRLSGFAFNMILLAVASLFLVRATIGSAGLDKWSSIILAQALAQVASTIVGCGYGVNGPAIVASRNLREGVEYFRLAERTRLVVALPCFVLMVGAMFVIPNPDPIVGLFGATPLALGSFSAAFFFTGREDSRWLLLAETCPRVTAMVVGAISLSSGVPLLIGLAIPALGTAAAILTSNVWIRRSAKRASGETNHAAIASELRNQFRPVISYALTNGAVALPVFVVTAIAPQLVGPFGVFDRLQRQATVALSPVQSTLQGWVPRRVARDNTLRPVITAMIAGAGFAVAVLIAFAVLGPLVISWLAAGQLRPTFVEGLLCGAIVATSMLANVIAYACLVPLGGIGGVIVGNVVGIGATLIAVPIMLWSNHSVGHVLVALLVGNIAQLIVQMFVVWRRIAKESLTR